MKPWTCLQVRLHEGVSCGLRVKSRILVLMVEGCGLGGLRDDSRGLQADRFGV